MSPSTAPIVNHFLPTAPPAVTVARARTIDLWCNFVAGGWSPYDLDSGLGGSEECLVLWATALAERGHRVRIYHNPPNSTEHAERAGVRYLPHFRFDPDEPRDVMVSWKSPHPWAVGARAGRRIHWSSDVERPWPARMMERLDAFLCLTRYHRGTMPWLDDAKTHIVPHGIDLKPLERQRKPKVPGRALYASSPDRGLLTLLRDWPRIRLEHPTLTLDVTYGWKRFLACSAGNPSARVFRAALDRLMGQEGIVAHGQVTRPEMDSAYWEAEYWVHPLNRADSELFCLNAVKAAHCGALAVVNRIGALGDTVTRWIDYPAFVRGEMRVGEADPQPIFDWAEVVARCWEPLFDGR
jgi:glycosyltransferase involved in cell wall biosynthesis